MSQPLRTCSHLNETGDTCNSVAAKDQKYCAFHLHYRARQLRMAQMRARCERFHLQLPPLDSMYAVQSALSQLAEALAADMIDLKRANSLLSILRLASLNLRHPEKWHTNLYHSDQPAEVKIADEYGLPRDLDLDTPPDLAFPQSGDPQSVTVSEGVAPGASPLSPDFGDRVGDIAIDLAAEYGLPSDLDLDTPPELAFPPPILSDLSSRAEPPAFGGAVEGAAFRSQGTAVPDDLRTPHVPDNFDFTPDYPITPEYVELDEVLRTQGSEASSARSGQLMRNEGRRRLHSERKRYAKVAARINLYRAAEKLAERKLAEQKLAERDAAKKPPASATGGPVETVTEKEATIA